MHHCLETAPKHFLTHIQIGLLGLLVCACNDGSNGGGTGNGLGPSASGQGRHAAYVDRDGSSSISPGDELWVLFPEALALGPGANQAFELVVDGDRLGAAEVMLGEEPGLVRILLGADDAGAAPSLRTRGIHMGDLAVNSPSGLRVALDSPDGALVSAASGLDAMRGGLALDLVPEFTSSSSLPAASEVLSADMDSDGRPDLLSLVTGPEGVLSIFRQGAANGLNLSLTQTIEGVQTMTVFDTDQDARPDIVLALENGEVQVWRNTSSGPGEVSLFKAVCMNSGFTTAPQVIGHADLNADGDEDLLLGFETDLFRAFGEEGSSFSLLESIGAPNDSYERILTTDLDQDGNIDIVAGGANADRILFLAADGSIANMVERIGDLPSVSTALGDINGDGATDLLLATNESLLLWPQEPSGVFDPSNLSSVQMVPGTRKILLRDIDGDQALDVLRLTDAGFDVLGGDGIGAFTRSPRLNPISGGSAMTLADFDSDGDGDLVIAAQASRLLLGSASGGFGSSSFFAEAEAQTADQFPGLGVTFAVVHGDWDADGDLDVVTGSTGSVRLWRNIGDGNLELDTTLSVQSDRPQALALVDVDLDGDLDLFAAAVGESNHLWLADPPGVFPIQSQPIAPDSQGTALAIADVDGDGDPDLLLGTVRNQIDRILLNGGRVPSNQRGSSGDTIWAGFDSEFAFPESSQTNAILATDLDSDGDLDLVLAHGFGSPDTFWRNTLDSGLFGYEEVLLPGLPDTSTVNVFALDANADGFPDLIFASRPEVLVFLGDGQLEPGSFQLGSSLPGAGLTDIAIGDLNGDSRLDLVIGGGFGTNTRVHLGGALGFNPGAEQILATTSVSDLALGDRDGDGDLDLVIVQDAPGTPNLAFRNR